MATLTKIQIAALSVEQRLALLDDLWDSLGDAQDAFSPPDWHQQVLEKRLAAAEQAPQASISWQEARAKLAKKWLD